LFSAFILLFSVLLSLLYFVTLGGSCMSYADPSCFINNTSLTVSKKKKKLLDVRFQMAGIAYDH
jgi:hypothetical protein